MSMGGTLTFEAENIKDLANGIAPNLSGEVVKLSIKDDGAGIPVEHLKQIFDPYYTTKQTGSGLGLATVHSIIKKHNGHIGVISESGIGTIFTIHLPADSSQPQTTDTISPESTDKAISSSGNILVMDDDEMILELATEMIRSFGYTVATAVDGKDALEKYISAKKSGKPFDVVIMDLTIPGGMGGEETLHEILVFDPEAKANINLIAMGDHDKKVQYAREHRLSYFVDDRIETCQQMAAANITPFVYTQPWNKNCANLQTVSSWLQIRTLIDLDNIDLSTDRL